MPAVPLPIAVLYSRITTPIRESYAKLYIESVTGCKHTVFVQCAEVDSFFGQAGDLTHLDICTELNRRFATRERPVRTISGSANISPTPSCATNLQSFHGL